MKKILVVFIVLLATGCSETQKTMKCTRTLNKNEAFFDLQYEVTYTGSYVDTFKSVETITTDDEELLETYQEMVEKQYEPYEGIDYYDYSVSIDGAVLTSTTAIDYSKVDTSKMIEVDKANEQLIEDGKIKIDIIKSSFEQMGITCENN